MEDHTCNDIPSWISSLLQNIFFIEKSHVFSILLFSSWTCITQKIFRCKYLRIRKTKNSNGFPRPKPLPNPVVLQWNWLHANISSQLSTSLEYFRGKNISPYFQIKFFYARAGFGKSMIVVLLDFLSRTWSRRIRRYISEEYYVPLPAEYPPYGKLRRGGALQLITYIDRANVL